MTYAAITTAMKDHQAAAKIIRYAGFKATCVNNAACDQPWQVNAKCTVEEAGQMQEMISNMFKGRPINIVAI